MKACAGCSVGKAGQDGLCSACRLRKFAANRKRYFFTAELERELREAYLGDRRQLSEALGRLVAKTGCPRSAFKNQAAWLGITRTPASRPWTPKEDKYLAEHAGARPAKVIAKALGRSSLAVKTRAERVAGRSLKVREGYTLSELMIILAASKEMGKTLLERGYFGNVRHVGVNQVRISEEAVARFLVEHPDKYDLRRVDQVWYKAVLFGRTERSKCGYDRIRGGQ